MTTLPNPSSRSEAPEIPEPGLSRADRVERFLAVYLQESMLWPVFLAIAAHVWVALSAVLLMVVRDQNLFAVLPLFIIFVGSSLLVRFGLSRRHRVIPALVASSWVIAVFLAWIADRYSVY